MPTAKQKANLRNLRDRTPEERREIARKGGLVSRKSHQQRRLMRETVADILALPAVFNGKELTDPVTGEPLENMQAALVVATLKQALKGNTKAAAKIVEWLGEANSTSGITINVALGK